MDNAPKTRKFPRVFWFLVTGTFVNKLGNFLYTFLAYYLTRGLGFSDKQAGLAASFYGVGSMVAGPLGGFMADRLGRRNTMVLSMAASAAAMLHLGTARHFSHVLVAAFLLGMVGDLYRPAVNAIIADIVPKADRVHAYGWNYWAANLGFSGASLLGGLLSTVSFALLFYVDAGSTLLFGMLVSLFVPETRPGVHKHSPSPLEPTNKTYKSPYRDGLFLGFLGIQFLMQLLFRQFIVPLPLDMEKHGISAKTYGILIAFNGIFIIVFQPLLRAWLYKRFKPAHLLASAAVLMGVGFGMNAITLTWIPWAVLSIYIWTLGEILMTLVVPAFVAGMAPPDMQGRYQGAYQLSGAIAMLLAPLYGSFLLSYFGSRVLWVSCLVLGCMAAVLHLYITPFVDRRIAEAADS